MYLQENCSNYMVEMAWVKDVSFSYIALFSCAQGLPMHCRYQQNISTQQMEHQHV
jgi:hypothetical protein